MDRNELRGKIFGIKPKSKIVQFEGAEIEIRQPSVGEVLNSLEDMDRKKATVRMLINYCYVPGTNDKVFEAADEEALLTVPFGEEWTKMMSAIDELSNLTNIKKEEQKNSDASNGDAQS